MLWRVTLGISPSVDRLQKRSQNHEREGDGHIDNWNRILAEGSKMGVGQQAIREKTPITILSLLSIV